MTEIEYLFSKVSLVSKDSSMLDGLDNASIEMEEAKVCNLFAVLYFASYIKRSKMVIKVGYGC